MKKILIIISLLLCLSLTLTGCGGSSETDSLSGDSVEEEKDSEEASEGTEEEASEGEEASDEEAETEEVISEGTEVEGTYEFELISNLCDYWNDLYTANEAVLNAYEGVMMETVTPGLCFLTGAQYDLLNIESLDGRFEGDLMFAGFHGFVEKNGPIFTFGYDDILEEDGFSPSMKKGDRKLEIGGCDLDKGSFFADNYTERNGIKVDRTTSEFQKQEDGSMCTIVMSGYTLDYNGEEDLRTSYIFIRNGKDQYDIVVANSEVGTEYEFIKLEANMTKEQATKAFEAAGATIEKSAGIKGGVFALD